MTAHCSSILTATGRCNDVTHTGLSPTLGCSPRNIGADILPGTTAASELPAQQRFDGGGGGPIDQQRLLAPDAPPSEQRHCEQALFFASRERTTSKLHAYGAARCGCQAKRR